MEWKKRWGNRYLYPSRLAVEEAVVWACGGEGGYLSVLLKYATIAPGNKSIA